MNSQELMATKAVRAKGTLAATIPLQHQYKSSIFQHPRVTNR